MATGQAVEDKVRVCWNCIPCCVNSGRSVPLVPTFSTLILFDDLVNLLGVPSFLSSDTV